jgi:hypothetical protein
MIQSPNRETGFALHRRGNELLDLCPLKEFMMKLTPITDSGYLPASQLSDFFLSRS